MGAKFVFFLHCNDLVKFFLHQSEFNNAPQCKSNFYFTFTEIQRRVMGNGVNVQVTVPQEKTSATLMSTILLSGTLMLFSYAHGPKMLFMTKCSSMWKILVS